MRPWLWTICLLCSCGPAAVDHAEALKEQAWQAYYQGRDDAARLAAEQGLTFAKQEKLPQWEARFTLLTLEFHPQKTKAAQAAIPLLKQLATTTDAFPALDAWRLTILGDFYGRSDQRELALDHLQQAVTRAQQHDDGVRLSDATYRLASYHRGAEKVQLLRQSIVAARQHPGGAFYEVRSGSNLGYAYFVSRDYNRALSVLERIQHLLAKFPRYQAVALANLGTVYNKLGYLDNARQVLETALAVEETGKNPILKSNLLAELGNFAFANLDFDTAQHHYLRALELAPNNREKLKWAVNVSHAALELEDYATADQYNQMAFDLLAEAWQYLEDRLIMQRAIIGSRQSPTTAEDQLTSFLDLENVMTQFYAYKELARAAQQLGQKEKAANYFRKGLQQLEMASRELDDTETQIVFFAKSTYFLREYVDWLVDQNRHEDALSVVSFAQGRSLARHDDAAWPGLRQKLADLAEDQRFENYYILNYFLSDQGSHLWVIHKQQIQYVALPSNSLIQENLDRWLTATLDKQAGVERNVGLRLTEKLLPPRVMASLPREATLLIVPDGPMNRLNMETLPIANDWLIQHFTLATVPSLRVLQPQQASKRNIGKILTLTDPDYASVGHRRLFTSAQTVPKLAQLFGSERITALSGAAATPDAFRAAVPQNYDLIHIGTHGEANLYRPLSSALILAPSEDGAFKLHAEDLLGHPLGAELVNLSSCESAGIRAYQGEGLVGMAWVFLRAGARHVIAGLWQVADEPTTVLMGEMYTELARGDDPITALRLAKLAAIDSGDLDAEPYYWGAFPIYIR